MRLWRGSFVRNIFHVGNTIHLTSTVNSTVLTNNTDITFGSYHFHTKAMSKTALLIIAEGSEEIEAVTPISTLRRAGIELTVAGLNGVGPYNMSRNAILSAEKSLKEALASAPFDAVILPGGLKGAEAFAESNEVGELLKNQEKAGRLVAAICAGPTALHKHNVCIGKSLTSHPSVKDKMTVEGKYTYKEDRVVVDDNLITSRGPGTSLEFSLAIAAYLVGKEKSDEIGQFMLK